MDFPHQSARIIICHLRVNISLHEQIITHIIQMRFSKQAIKAYNHGMAWLKDHQQDYRIRFSWLTCIAIVWTATKGKKKQGYMFLIMNSYIAVCQLPGLPTIYCNPSCNIACHIKVYWCFKWYLMVFLMIYWSILCYTNIPQQIKRGQIHNQYPGFNPFSPNQYMSIWKYKESKTNTRSVSSI